MANKQTNKERSECCGQGCNNHENRICSSQERIDDDTCSYVTRITIGIVVAVGSIFLLLNSFVFPNL